VTFCIFLLSINIIIIIIYIYIYIYIYILFRVLLNHTDTILVVWRICTLANTISDLKLRSVLGAEVFVSGKIFAVFEIYAPTCHSRLEETLTMRLGLWPCPASLIESDATYRRLDTFIRFFKLELTRYNYFWLFISKRLYIFLAVPPPIIRST